MKPAELSAKLRVIRNKRDFAMRHGLPQRTLWRLISDTPGNPSLGTAERFLKALRADKRAGIQP